MISSGLTESICVIRLAAAEVMVCRLMLVEEDVASGRLIRHLRENLASKESRMQTASAIVSRGSAARVMMACTRGMEGAVMDADGGWRLARWTAGPACKIVVSQGRRNTEGMTMNQYIGRKQH